MKKMKNFLVLCSAAFCFALALSGCNNGGGASNATYTVTFDSNGGSAVEAQTVKHGEKVTKPADPTKTDYVFAGWYEDSVTVTPFDFNIEITADWTLYAGWKTNSSGGGSGDNSGSGDSGQTDNHSGSKDAITTGATAKVGQYYYELASYTETMGSPVAAWKNEAVDAEANDEVVFYVDGQVMSVFSDGDSDGNNITEAHPMTEAVQSVHIKTGGTMAIYFKQWNDGVYTFWITTPSGGGSSGGNTPNPGEGYALAVEVAADFQGTDEGKYGAGGAVTYIYAFKGDANEWLDAASGSVTIPNTYDHFIVVRMDPSKPGTWDGKWNQTADIAIDTSKTKVIITGWGEGTLAYSYE